MRPYLLSFYFSPFFYFYARRSLVDFRLLTDFSFTFALIYFAIWQLPYSVVFLCVSIMSMTYFLFFLVVPGRVELPTSTLSV